MNNEVIIIGSGGHCRSLIPLLEHNNITIKGIYDESYQGNIKENILGYELTGDLSMIAPEDTIVLAVGNNTKRADLFSLYNDQILKENIIHPSAVLERDIEYGVSNAIFANVFINSLVRIGSNNIINSGAIVEHEAIIGDNNHISIGSILAGRVKIGSNCFIGAGAVVRDTISICDNVTVGANSFVTRDINEPGTYFGSPARKIK